MHRREFLRTSAAASVATALPGAATAQAPSPTQARVLRIAHLTDVHVQPERGGGDGMAAALRHAQDHAKPDLVLFGGDNLMSVDSNEGREPARVQAQLALWKSVLRNESSVPYRTCIGNHDVLAQREDGKAWACDAFAMDRRYYAWEQAGWKFICLDSTFSLPDGYTAKLDDEQFDWLTRELESTPKEMPVLVLSHIPVICACAMFDGEGESTGNWQIPGAWMHIDARRIKNLFWKHRNVRVALSGHIHLVDRVDYLGTTYLCNGAVCAGWWKGDCQEATNGYGVVDLYADGSCRASYEPFGWSARE